LAKRSVREIIEDWAFSVWKEELPRTFHTRRDAYYRLFDTLAQEGYGWDDVSLQDDKYIKSFTVGKKGTCQQRAEWNEYADKHILDAKIHSFGTRGAIADSKSRPKGPEKQPEAEAAAEEPKPSKFKKYVPDPKNLEEIDKMFRFQFTDEDIG